MDEHVAGRALDLPARELFPTLQMLVAMRTSKLEFGFGHKRVLFAPEDALNRSDAQ